MQEGMDMNYGMEELLPLVAKLTDQYTSKESSSVPYETARTLMEAVMYCINECLRENGGYGIRDGKKPEARVLYEKGCEIVESKVYMAKERYEELIRDFEDYGCKNYKATILGGMPEFFLRYDAKFNPQNHMLLLDYPLLAGNPNLCGVDLILEYLNGIWLEKRFLDYFDRRRIVGLLEKILPEYPSLYLDNLCYPVLLNAVACIIADKPIGGLELEGADYGEVEAYFTGCGVKKTEQTIKGLIRMLISQIMDGETAEYFEKAASGYAVRIVNGIRDGSLEQVIC